ncbi:MAG: RNA-directed DNA polymerase [Rhodobacterales bacterium]
MSWALHGFNEGKTNRRKSLLGNKIDQHIQNSRHGQTNGIVQGSVLMDIIAELVLGFVDCEISKKLKKLKLDKSLRILRYRDDYRIFAQNDSNTEIALKAVSDSLRIVGMKLGSAKTSSSTNIVEAAIKPEKLAAIQLADMDIQQAKTMQKQLLRLHAFARKYPNSGALNRLASDAFEKIRTITRAPNDIAVQIAIVADIAAISPQAFPALSGVLAKLISLAPDCDRSDLWSKVAAKMRAIPYNGYMEIWLQRVTQAKGLDLDFKSDEAICGIVDGNDLALWNNSWIDEGPLLDALAVKRLKVGVPEDFEGISETLCMGFSPCG